MSYDFAPQKQTFLLAAASARVGDRREVGYITGMGNIEFRHKRIDSMKAVLAEGFDAAFVGSGAPRGQCARPQGRRRQYPCRPRRAVAPRHANVMARRLADGLSALPGTRLLYPVEADEIFIMLPAAINQPLEAAGARYYPSPSDRPDERAYWLTAFNTNQSVIDQFLSIGREA